MFTHESVDDDNKKSTVDLAKKLCVKAGRSVGEEDIRTAEETSPG